MQWSVSSLGMTCYPYSTRMPKSHTQHRTKVCSACDCMRALLYFYPDKLIFGNISDRVFETWRQTKTSQNATNLGKLEKFGAFWWECSSKIAVLDPVGASGLDDIVRDGKGCSKRRWGRSSWRIGRIRWQHVLEERVPIRNMAAQSLDEVHGGSKIGQVADLNKTRKSKVSFCEWQTDLLLRSIREMRFLQDRGNCAFNKVVVLLERLVGNIWTSQSSDMRVGCADTHASEQESNLLAHA